MDFNTILNALFSPRQLELWGKVPQVICSIFSGGISFKHLLMSILFVLESPFLLIYDKMGIVPAGQALDLTDYSLVFCDDFDGDELDTDVWFYRGTGVSGGGYAAPSQVRLENGNMIITGEYLENGQFGAGWYSGAAAIKKQYKRGYFEIRCICSKGKGFWSAFWIQADHPYDPEISKGGIGGAEIDIFESLDYGRFLRSNTVMSTIHCSGMEGDTSGGLNSYSIGDGAHYLGNDIYNKYNTYGCEWTEDEYIFYINGIETGRTSWADGVSQVPETVIVEIPINGNVDELMDRDTKAEFIVDYVKIYQK